MNVARGKIPDRLIATGLLTLLLATLSLYAWGYFALSTRQVLFGYDGSVLRTFRARWQAQIYQPAAFAEGVLIRIRVRAEFDPGASAGS